MKDTNFLNSIKGSFIVNDAEVSKLLRIETWYLPARLLGISWFINIYRSQFVEHFMECAKTRNWEYRTIENLAPIDWRVKPDGIRIESRKSY